MNPINIFGIVGGFGRMLDRISIRKPPKIYNDLSTRWKRNRNAVAHSVDSRQQQRARPRVQCFEEINKNYGPEPRRARRALGGSTIARVLYF